MRPGRRAPCARTIIGACTLVMGLPAAAPAADLGKNPCANFAQVDGGLYRGAQPGDACLEQVAALGIRTVVNLRDEEDDSERERFKALALGLRYLNLAMSGFSRPQPDVVERVLKAIRAEENRPVFVHCKKGRDRTGVIVAAYRMADQGWSGERALEEARRFGLAWWQIRMRTFIRDFGESESSDGTAGR